MKIGMVGSGAMGLFYGAKLARAGADVHFLMRRGYEEAIARGIRVKSIHGDFEISNPQVYQDPSLMGKCDLVIICLKATQNHALPEILKNVCHESTKVLTLQNGLGNEDVLSRCLPGTSILGGVAFVCLNRITPASVDHIQHGHIAVSTYVQGQSNGDLEKIKNLFENAGIGCDTSRPLKEIRWRKLVWNVPFNGLGIASPDTDVEVVMKDGHFKKTVRELMAEVLAIAAADGCEIEDEFIDYQMKRSEVMGPYRSSSQIDLEENREVEVEAILGEPLRVAELYGVETPLLRMLYAIACRQIKFRQKVA